MVVAAIAMGAAVAQLPRYYVGRHRSTLDCAALEDVYPVAARDPCLIFRIQH